MLLPIAPGLTPREPIRLRSVRRGYATLRVRLRDVEGRPAHGTVVSLETPEQAAGHADHAATTDGRGEVVFRDLTSGPYKLRGYLDGPLAPVPDSDPATALPPDAALRGQVVVPVTTVAVAPGRETVVELRARPAGYVRGTIRPPAGHEVGEYLVSPDGDRTDGEATLQLDPGSGRFLDGPLPAEKVTYHFMRQAEDLTWHSAKDRVVAVPAGEIADVELRIEETGPQSTPRWQRSGPGGVDELERDPGSVVLHDGTTPAFGAEALLYVPEHADPVSAAFSDVAGRLAWRGQWFSPGPEAGTGPVDRPTIVVRIPGQVGAAILPVEPGRPVRMTLPAPREATGQVTLGGRPGGGRNARIRVVAAHQDRGVLGRAARRRDDSPGRRLLRAPRPDPGPIHRPGRPRRDLALFERRADRRRRPRPPAPLALDIPAPGRPLSLQIVDPESRPAAEWPIGLVRPAGPLASLWPTAVHTGPDGTLTLRGLEAGRHAILVGEGKERREVVVPAADGAEGGPVVERIVVPRVGS